MRFNPIKHALSVGKFRNHPYGNFIVHLGFLARSFCKYYWLVEALELPFGKRKA